VVVCERAHAFSAALYRLVIDELFPALAAESISLRAFADLTEGNRGSLDAFFKESVLPVLTPLAIDAARPFPLLASLSLNIAPDRQSARLR
jgi:polyphosphate kinase